MNEFNSDSKKEFDLAVIGAGTAGMACATVAASLGARVALIEKHRVGGEHLWTGCVPSKTLVKAARVFDTVKRAEEFGVHVEKPRLVWNAVRLRLEAVRDEIKALERKQLANAAITILSGVARFTDGSTLRVSGKDGEQNIRAGKFVIATGTQPLIPDIDGLDTIDFLTHRQLFEMRNLPRSWIILGGGPTGCELAQVLVRFDCKVTLLESESTLLAREDSEVSAACERILRNEGVQIFCNTRATRAWIENEKKHCEFTYGGESRIVSASGVLVAVGKVAQLGELNLAAIGAQWSAQGLDVNEHLQTAAPNVCACGDVTGQFSFTHVAEAQGKIAAQNALLPNKKKWDARVVPRVTFTDPEIARVGFTEEEARRTLHNIKVYRQKFAHLDRAIIEGETQGFLKVITTSSGRIIGAHIVGMSAGELIHPFVAAVRDETLIQEFAETLHVYPTLSEIGHRAGDEAYRELLKIGG